MHTLWHILSSRRASRTSAIAVAAVLSLALFACSDSDPDPVDDPNQNANQQPNQNGGTDDPEEDPVELAITAPEEGSYHTRDRVVISGTADGADQIDVNGETVTVEDGQWEIPLRFEDGPVTVVASAGDAEETVEFIVDTIRPRFVIDSPERGTVIDAEAADDNKLTFSGQLQQVGPSGLLVLEVGGQFLEPDAEGYFEGEVTLQEGLNIFALTAQDRAHNKTTEHRAVIYGPLAPADAPINSAAGAEIEAPDGTDAIASVISAYITPEQIEGFLEGGFAADGVDVDLDELHWEDLEISIVPRNGYLELEMTMNNLHVAGAFGLGGGSTEGSLSIASVLLTMEIALSVGDDSELEVEILEEYIELGEVTVNVDGEDQDWAGPLVAFAIGFAFTQFLPQLIEENLYDPDLLTQEVEFLDRTLTITLILENILITNRGISAVLGVEFPGDKYPAVPDVAGALNRPIGESQGGSVDRHVVMHSTRTTFDRVLHSLWYSGLFHQQLGNEQLADADIPFSLTASGMGLLLDQRIMEIHESNTPVELRLRPLLAPVIEFGSDDSGTVRLGDLLIDFLLLPEDEAKETLFLTVALQIDLDVDFDIGAESVDLGIGVQAKGDVVAEPIFEFDHDKTTELIVDLLELIPQLAASDLNISPETSLEWATITDPMVAIHGSDNNRISVGINIEPAEDFIEEDVVEEDNGD